LGAFPAAIEAFDGDEPAALGVNRHRQIIAGTKSFTTEDTEETNSLTTKYTKDH
jgi:hypothetical protein